MAADRERRQRGERLALGMAGDRARRVGAGHYDRGEGRIREGEIDVLQQQQRRDRDLVPARAQAPCGALAVGIGPGHQQPHAYTGAKKSAPARALSSRPASAPSATASATTP